MYCLDHLTDARKELLAVMIQDAPIPVFVKITVVGKNVHYSIHPKIAFTKPMEHGQGSQVEMFGWQNFMVYLIMATHIFSLSHIKNFMINR